MSGGRPLPPCAERVGGGAVAGRENADLPLLDHRAPAAMECACGDERAGRGGLAAAAHLRQPGTVRAVEHTRGLDRVWCGPGRQRAHAVLFAFAGWHAGAGAHPGGRQFPLVGRLVAAGGSDRLQLDGAQPARLRHLRARAGSRRHSGRSAADGARGSGKPEHRGVAAGRRSAGSEPWPRGGRQ